MSSSPKYSEVDVVGEAARTLARQVEASYQRAADEWDKEMQRRREARLESERSQIQLTSQRLSQQILGFASQADADVIGDELGQLRDRLSRCSNVRPNDLSSAHSLVKELTRIERALKTSHRRLEAVRLKRSLDGVSRQVKLLKSELHELDRRDCERFDPGALDTITQSVAIVERQLSHKRLNEAETALSEVRQRLDAHIERVQAGRDQRDRDRHAAEQAIVATVDRYDALASDGGLAKLLADDLRKLQPDLQVLRTLLATEQFANTHQQVSRLNERLDHIVATARSQIEQAERQKLIAERLMSVVTSARGIVLVGFPENGGTRPAQLRFKIEGRGILELTVGLEGPILVRAEGFKHEQRLSPSGSIERSCDSFVSWFDEQIREGARREGIPLGALHWDGEPKPTQSRAPSLQASHHRTANSSHTRSQR